MKKFSLYEDEKVSMWIRSYYTVEAETLEEAVQLVKDRDADVDESETLYDCGDELIKVSDNGGFPTREIYDSDSNEELWNNSECL